MHNKRCWPICCFDPLFKCLALPFHSTALPLYPPLALSLTHSSTADPVTLCTYLYTVKRNVLYSHLAATATLTSMLTSTTVSLGSCTSGITSKLCNTTRISSSVFVCMRVFECVQGTQKPLECGMWYSLTKSAFKMISLIWKTVKPNRKPVL